MSEAVGTIKYDFDALPLYGRNEEIKALRNSWDQIKSIGDQGGGTSSNNNNCGPPQVVLIGGSSGTGKSQLIASSLGVPVLQQKFGFFVMAKYDQLQDRSQPFYGILKCLGDLILAIKERLTRKEIGRIQVEILKNRDHINEMTALAAFIPALREIFDDQNFLNEKSEREFNLEHGFDRLAKSVRNLFRAICGSLNGPVGLFMDDLQWADPGSFSLFETIASDRKIRNLLLIGAYRDNEVTESHNLSKVMSKLRNTQRMKEMRLSNISSESINQMLVDMSNLRPEVTKDLADSVHKKTHGNPFFVVQYLQLLFRNRYIRISQQTYKWEWDLAEIMLSTDVSDNVVELVASKIGDLPTKTIQALKVAACLGCRFRVDVIEIAMMKLDYLDEDDLDIGTACADALKVAVEECLIECLSGEGGSQLRYKFCHDKIQQSVYENLLSEEERVKIHYNIGTFLLTSGGESLSDGRRESQRTMLMTDQLNRGAVLLKSKEAKFRLARSNFDAAEAAKKQSAFFSAVDYLCAGISLLEEGKRWSEYYDFMLEMMTELAQHQNAIGDFDGCQITIDDILHNAKCFDDKLPAYIQRLESYGAKGRVDGAIKVAVGALRELGQPISAKPSFLAVGKELAKAKLALRNMTDEKLLTLPLVTDLRMIAVFKILCKVGIFAFHGAMKNLFAVTSFRAVSLMLKHGLYSAYEFSAYGVVCSVMGDLKGAYRFGELSNKSAPRFSNEAYSRATNINFIFLYQLREPFHDMVDPILNAYLVGMQVGNPNDATNASCCYLYAYFQCSLPLEPLAYDLEEFGSEMERYSQTVLYQHTCVLHQVVLNLLGRSDDPLILNGDAMEENGFRKTAAKAVLTHFWMLKTMLGITFCDWRAAGNAVEYCWALNQDDDANIMSSFTRRFFMGIASLRMAMITRKRIHRRRGRAMIKFMERSLKNRNVNCYHMLKLLKAEHLNLNKSKVKDDSTIQKAYDEAISSARRSGFLHHAAMAFEMAGLYFLDIDDLDEAQYYLGKARELYLDWGAQRKVKAMEFEHKHLDLDREAVDCQSQASGTSGNYRGVSRYQSINSTAARSRSGSFDGGSFASPQPHRGSGCFRSSLHSSVGSLRSISTTSRTSFNLSQQLQLNGDAVVVRDEKETQAALKW